MLHRLLRQVFEISKCDVTADLEEVILDLVLPQLSNVTHVYRVSIRHGLELDFDLGFSATTDHLCAGMSSLDLQELPQSRGAEPSFPLVSKG